MVCFSFRRQLLFLEAVSLNSLTTARCGCFYIFCGCKILLLINQSLDSVSRTARKDLSGDRISTTARRVSQQSVLLACNLTYQLSLAAAKLSLDLPVNLGTLAMTDNLNT